MWPDDQLYMNASMLSDQASRCEGGFDLLCRQMGIDADSDHYLQSLYLPFAAWLARFRQTQDSADAVVLGLCGAQGSGKSAVARLLSYVLGEAFGLATVTISIGDIYKTKENREMLAEDIQPLFLTADVPMTHDVDLGIETIKRLRCQAASQGTLIPVFDQALDSRLPEYEWPFVTGDVDIVIFEGWCVGARPQDGAALVRPINALEAEEDPSGIWRQCVNQALSGPYQSLFSLIDVLVLLKAPSMAQAFEWHRQQERRLRAARADTSETLSVNSDQRVDRFVMHYERLTRHILDEMPARADIVLELDATHNVDAVVINTPIERVKG